MFDAEFVDALAESGAGDAQQLGGLHLIAVGIAEGVGHEFALDRRKHGEVGLGLGPLKKGRSYGADVVGGCRRGFRLAKRLATGW